MLTQKLIILYTHLSNILTFKQQLLNTLILQDWFFKYITLQQSQWRSQNNKIPIPLTWVELSCPCHFIVNEKYPAFHLFTSLLNIHNKYEGCKNKERKIGMDKTKKLNQNYNYCTSMKNKRYCTYVDKVDKLHNKCQVTLNITFRSSIVEYEWIKERLFDALGLEKKSKEQQQQGHVDKILQKLIFGNHHRAAHQLKWNWEQDPKV